MNSRGLPDIFAFTLIINYIHDNLGILVFGVWGSLHRYIVHTIIEGMKMPPGVAMPYAKMNSNRNDPE
jgi:hypothetical protein